MTLEPVLMDGPFQEAQYLEAFQTMTRNGAQAVLIGNIGEHFANRRLIGELATRHRLPTMAPGREFVGVGGLMAYGVSYPDNWRRAALRFARNETGPEGHPTCPACGYDLRATPGRCPECGVNPIR